MIKSDVITRVVAQPGLLEAVAPAAVIPDAIHDPHGLTPGMRLQARVEVQLASGDFRVRVGDTLMRTQLPAGTRPGTTLELVFIGARPRLTFMLLNPPPTAPGYASLSPAARLLATLAQETKSNSAATPPYQADPVLGDAPDDIGEFSARLQQAFSRSGLFYESHQAQWLTGQRTREQLLQEPQGRLSAASATAGDLDIAPATAGHDAPADGGSEARMVHGEALPQVRQQLAALETGHVNWRGEVWPGQTMDWEIEGEPPDPDTPGDPHRWHSRLRLTLPRLGQVTAMFTLEQRGVRIAMSAGTAPAVETLRTGQPFLVRAMHGSGLGVSGIEVRRDDE